MTIRPVILHPSALAEAEWSLAWYQERSVRAAQRFLDELDRSIQRISTDPLSFEQWDLGTRRALLRRFPYMLIFRESERHIEIVAIAHSRRRPDYWFSRL